VVVGCTGIRYLVVVVILPKFLKYVGCLFEYDDFWWGR
jgi:hypothetical protein